LDLFFVVFEFLWFEAVLSSLGFAAFLLVSSIIYLSRLALWKPSGDMADGKITCVIPTFMDAEVLDRSVESILESSYRDFEVLIVCESSDDKGIEKAESLSTNGKVDFLINEKYPGSKAGAMNLAAEETDSEYIAFFDSDQRVRPSFISEMVSQLQSHEIVQARNVPKPDGLIESLSYYESVFFTYVSRQLLGIVTGFKLIGSRSIAMQREVFDDLGGYSEDTLTEDYDFAHKCYLNDVDIVDVPLPVENLAAHSLRDWWGQRKRWMTGYFEVLAKYMKRVFYDFRGLRSIVSVLISAGSLIGSFLMLTLVSKFIVLLILGAGLIYMIPVGVILMLALVFRVYDVNYNFPGRIGFSWLLVPVIFPFFGLITVRSFFEFLFNQGEEWYRVKK
jgi:cellulose synthase/poly-beta-1,6-N-acetylglucosamine synthase-like glycosyltransferase